MLREVARVRQHEGEARRRWFTDEYFDLIVWLDEADRIVGFQLTYEKPRFERALTWQAGQGFAHNRIDDGEGRPSRLKSTPILVADGQFDAAEIGRRFEQASAELPEPIAAFVLERIRGYPAG